MSTAPTDALLARLRAAGFAPSPQTLPPDLVGPVSGYVTLVIDRLHLPPPLNGFVDARTLMARARWWGAHADFLMHAGAASAAAATRPQRICFPVHTPPGAFLKYARDMQALVLDIVEPPPVVSGVVDSATPAAFKCIGHVHVPLDALLQRTPLDAAFDIRDDTARALGRYADGC